MLARDADYRWQGVFLHFVVPLVFLSTLLTVFLMGPQVLRETDPVLLSRNQLFFITFAGSVFSILLSAYMIAAMSPRFKGSSSLDRTLALIAFSYTPVFLANMISALHISLQLLNLLALGYMVILFVRGASVMLDIPPERRVGFTITCLIILFAVRVLLAIMLGVLLI